jgi:hypothetical protein
MNQPAPFEIAPNEYGGMTASNGTTQLELRDADGRVFRRRAVRHFTEMVEWSVAELGGVRVYFDGVKVIVTRKDVRP